MRKVTLILAAALLAAPALAQAQQGTAQRTLVEGRRSIVFEWPLLTATGGHGRLEAWQMRSATRNLGFVLEGVVNRRTFDPGDATERETAIALGPALKRYMSIQSTLAPYLRGHALLGYSSQVSAADIEQRSWGLLVGGGVGVEWFPWERIGIGGYTGADLFFDRARLIRPTLEDERVTTLGFATRTSGLQVLIYF